MKRKEQYADEIIEMLERTKGGAWASNINLNTKDRVIEVCQNCVDSWSGRKFKDHCTTSPQALEQTRWIPVSERLPKSAGVYIVTREFTDGFECADLTDACYFDGTSTWHNDNRINHGREYVDKKIKAWMPLPTPYEPQESDNRRCDNCKYFGEILKDNIHSCNNNKSIFKACLETATGCEKFEPQEREGKE